jgi:hypothetical protein
MRNQGQLVLALLIIAAGFALLIGSILDINVWALCFPGALILLGLAILLRPQLVSSGPSAGYKVLGDIRRKGNWEVTDEELWIGIGDVSLDMTDAAIPAGETRLRIWSFVASVRLTVPEDVGVSVSSSAFVTDARFFGRKRDGILTPVRLRSENYDDAGRAIYLETTSFVGDVRVQRASESG